MRLNDFANGSLAQSYQHHLTTVIIHYSGTKPGTPGRGDLLFIHNDEIDAAVFLPTVFCLVAGNRFRKAIANG